MTLNGMRGERHLSSLSFLPDITLWGMELGLLSMRRGELARFLFKPTYAYGTLGCPPLIPPNATVLFEIELIDFLDSAESDKFCALSAVSSIPQIFQYFLKGEGSDCIWIFLSDCLSQVPPMPPTQWYLLKSVQGKT